MTTQSSRTDAPGFPGPRHPGDEAATRTSDRLVGLRRRLEATDLHPGPVTDAAFGELVGLCCHPPAGCAELVLQLVARHAGALRTLASTGEGHMERHWAERIARAADPRAELARFPYLGNYHDLVRLELAALAAAGAPAPRRVVVLGSGPLPLTGLVLAGEHEARVLHVDRDPAAVAAGDAVSGALGAGGRVTSLVADLAEPHLDPALAAALGAADLVLVGALVGTDAAAKAAITARLVTATGPDAVLLVRSATGLRTLLYPEVAPADLPALRVLLEVHPHTDVVNSVLVARAAT
ncbi:nicotianamine synthase family protein [Pseudonocardia spirodelae]|uniref:Nicotianamine synthase family protein n=1 Tax=Pseudonocardia spirodelae TaxID=3133431 RepID=A0ABU8TDP8_9PSEU